MFGSVSAVGDGTFSTGEICAWILLDRLGEFFFPSGNGWSMVFWRHCTDRVAVEMLAVYILGSAVCLVACPAVLTCYLVANWWVRAVFYLPPQAGAWGCHGGHDVYRAVCFVVIAGLVLRTWG